MGRVSMKSLLLASLGFGVFVKSEPIPIGNGVVEQVPDAFIDVNLDPETLASDVAAGVSTRGGVTMDNPLVVGGIGNKSNIKVKQDGDLTSQNVRVQDQADIGGGFGVGDLLSIDGGAGTKGDAKVGVDLQNMQANLKMKRDSGIGGTIGTAAGIINGGAGNSVDLNSALDLKNKTSALDFRSDTGTDGRVILPGELGSLIYHIDDVADVSSTLDFKDLSQRSLYILKETNIIANLDLPGDKLEDVNIAITPSIEIVEPIINLNNLGKLKVLSYADAFAKDLLAITDFNMLTESNVLKALSSGLELAARLDILRSLSKEIGVVTGMVGVVQNTRTVLADLVSILEALRRVKLLPVNVRSLGSALEAFDLGELNVDLGQLEAMSVAPSKATASGSDSAVAGAEMNNLIAKASSGLSGFQIDDMFDLEQLGTRLSSGVDGLQKGVSKVLSSQGVSNALNGTQSAAMITSIVGAVPSVVASMGQVSQLLPKGTAEAGAAAVENLAGAVNNTLNQTPAQIAKDVISGQSVIGNLTDVTSTVGNTTLGNATNALKKVADDLVGATAVNGVVKNVNGALSDVLPV